MINQTTKKTIMSFRNAAILAFIILISYAIILMVLRNEPYFKVIFSDVVTLIIELSVVLTLFYAAKLSVVYGRRIQTAWMLLAVAVLFFFLGDVTWTILEVGIHQNPFPSIADIFYLSFYPLFALGIYYIPRFSFKRSETLKIIIDMGIVIITVGLIFFSFMIIPAIISNTESFFVIILSVAYVVGDFVLLFALIRLLLNRFKNVYLAPLVLLAMGIIVLIVTDIIFSFQSIQKTFISGSLLDVGWQTGFVFIGLAGFLQVNIERYNYQPSFKLGAWVKKSNLTPYLPLAWVLIAYILLLWGNENLFGIYLEYIELLVGVIILLVLVRQAITLNENKNLYLAAGKEISNRERAEKDLKDSLKEKEILLQEIHHRVKNNLQMVSSLLNLQSSYIDDELALDILKKSQDRVKSMAFIHEQLYISRDMTSIKFSDYIQTLTSQLMDSYGTPNVKIKLDIDDVLLDINTAISCSLIINELLTNSIKHAFPNERKGEIHIELRREDENIILCIADNGIGFPEDIDFKKTPTLGLQLVNSLVEQIDGTIDLDRSAGTKFKIFFKIETD